MKENVPYVVFTDLDGTLLDRESYSYQAAKPALQALRRHRVPLVFCTSKTRAEVEVARRDFGNEAPFIVENGAAIFIPRGYFKSPAASAVASAKSREKYELIRLGVPYPQVVAALRRASAHSGCQVRGFHEMTAAEVAELSGLTLAKARLAKRREYDEPFLLQSESPVEIGGLLNRIEEEGFTWTRGGRFYHIRGHHNKGQAARLLITLFRRSRPEVITVGAGDGPNDISLLEAVDLPIWLPARDSSLRPGSSVAARLAPQEGPRGWNEAILQVLNGERPLTRATQ
jgi:mannosyl-3-phosphoglycerate phosphatase family protein